MGTETEILFVGAGDDPKEALAKYRQSLPAPEPEPKPAEPVPVPPPEAPVEGELPPPPEDNPEPATESIASLSEEQIQTQQRKAKMQKYLVLLGVSLGMTALVIARSALTQKPPPPRISGSPAQLTRDQIRDAISAVPDNIVPDATQAASELQLARQFYQNHFLEGQLYLCVRHYKLYLAYRGGNGFEDKTGEEEHRYRTVLNGDGQTDPGLIGRVCGKYELACEYEQAQRWVDAFPLFDNLVKMIPAPPEDPTYDRLVVNLKDHRKFVQEKMIKKK